MPTGIPRSWMCLTPLILAGCMTWRVANVSPTTLLEQSRPGKIRVERRGGVRTVLTQPALAGDSLRGREGSVAVADVTAIAVRKVSALRTMGLITGILGAAGVACAMSDCLAFETGPLGFGEARLVPR